MLYLGAISLFPKWCLPWLSSLCLQLWCFIRQDYPQRRPEIRLCSPVPSFLCRNVGMLPVGQRKVHNPLHSLKSSSSFHFGLWPRTTNSRQKLWTSWKFCGWKVPSLKSARKRPSNVLTISLGGDLGFPRRPLWWTGETWYLCWKVNYFLFTTYKCEFDIVCEGHRPLALARSIFAQIWC